MGPLPSRNIVFVYIPQLRRQRVSKRLSITAAVARVHMRRTSEVPPQDIWQRRNRGAFVTLDSKVAGVYAIAPTPFHENGAIDWLSIDRMVDFYFEVGCDGLTVLGVLGEAGKLDP